MRAHAMSGRIAQTLREDRWQHLLEAAFRLEAGKGRARLQEVLDSLLEVFPSSLDPVEDFEGFAVRRLAQALRRQLP
jgi:hypothetical protein